MNQPIAGRYAAILSAFVLALLFSQCRKDRFITDASALLSFSTDTIFFDTVFTTIGSTTQVVKVYNPHGDNIRIDRILLEGGADSPYRLNVDGVNGDEHTDIVLEPGDSMYVFVEVTVDPGNINTPFVVEDRLLFSSNGNTQRVELVAWGQDAYFHGQPGGLFVLECDEVWNNDKPHVVYGIVAVDSACTLTINEGTQVYCHARAGLYIYKGVLNVNGSLNNEVVFQGDRLEAFYDDVPGQWGIQLSFQVQGAIGPDIATITRGGIWFFQCRPSTINYAILKNGGNGIQVDTTGTDYTGAVPCLTLTNTKIQNMTGIGLWGQGAYIYGRNVLVSNCGESCAYLSIGGRYEMDNCTFANYYSAGSRTAPAFALNNYYEDFNQNTQIRPLIGCLFRNCIMYGSSAGITDFNEFVVDVLENDAQQWQFKWCLVDTDINVSDDGNRWESMRNGQAPFFCSPDDGNFKLSSADSRMAGFGFVFDPDINGLSNGDWKGCYDFDPNPDGPCGL